MSTRKGASTMATPSISLEEVLTEPYFLDLMNDVADDAKVEKLAIRLSVPEAVLTQLKKEFGVDTPLLATKVLMAWQKNLTCDTVEEARQQLATALKNIGLGRKAKQVFPQIGSRPHTPCGTTHITQQAETERDTTVVVRNPPPVHRPAGIPLTQTIRRKCSAATCGWIVCYMTLGVLVIIFLAAIPSLKYAPKASNRVLPPSIKANDTVELSFGLPTTWLHRLSLSIDSTCSGEVYTFSGKCSNLYSRTRVCYRESQFSPLVDLPIYLLSGSNISFSMPANFSSQFNIWVIWDHNLFNHNFSSTSCDNPPSQTHCLHRQPDTTHRLFNVTESAYYKYMFFPSTVGWHVRVNYYICSYDVSKLSEIVTPQEPIRSDLVDIDILYKPFTFDEVCTIFHVNNDIDCKYNRGGQLNSQVSRRQDILLFPGLLVTVAVLALLAVIGTHTVRAIRQRRATEPQYEVLGTTEEQV